MIGKLLKMQLLEDDDELAYSPTDKEEVVARIESDGRPSWMILLCSDLQDWSKMLPKVNSKL
jgi:dynein heavy chain 1, cytosolic